MENNLENKTLFFAQYYGQKVEYWKEEDFTYTVDCITTPQACLNLTPISQITDEDAAYIHFGATAEQFLIYYNQNTEKIIQFISAKDYDYLRSKGYALPFLGLSVEELISYGWLRLK